MFGVFISFNKLLSQYKQVNYVYVTSKLSNLLLVQYNYFKVLGTVNIEILFYTQFIFYNYVLCEYNCFISP